MLETVFWIAIGLFIGWNLPQPTWAKNIQNKFTSVVKSKE